MSSVAGFKKMNWFPKVSAWKSMETHRLKRKEMMAAFQEDSQALAAGFAQASALQIQSVGEIASMNAQSRLQAKAEEMKAEMDAKLAQFDKLA